ncbi:MAG: hypothetical protein H0V96_02395 [Acidimicrobiia bacterium]|nr:hypothetical protein [Acidimicrobiia bacterium]
MTIRTRRFFLVAVASIALGACGGGDLSVEDATAQACTTLDRMAGSLATLTEPGGTVDEIQEAGSAMAEDMAGLGDNVREALDDDTLAQLERAQNAYRRTLSELGEAAGADEIAEALSDVGADLQARYDEAVASLGC